MNDQAYIEKLEKIMAEAVKKSIEENLIEIVVDSIQEFSGEFLEDDEDRAYIIAINAKNLILKTLKDKNYE